MDKTANTATRAEKRKLKNKQKRLRRKEKKKQELAKAIIELPVKNNRQAVKLRSYKTNKKGFPTQFVPPPAWYKLSDREYKQAFDYLMNMLDPTTPYKFPRPVPARTYADLKTGEITWESTAAWVEVSVRPDVFQTVRIREIGADATVVLPDNFTEDFRVLTAGDPQADWLAGAYNSVSLQLALPLSNGTFLQPVRLNTGNNRDYYFSGGQLEEGAVEGFRGLLPPTATFLTASVQNRSHAGVNVRFGWKIYGNNGTLIGSPIYGGNVAIAAGATADVNSAAFGLLPTATPDQFTVLTLEYSVPATTEVSNFGFTLTSVSNLRTQAPVSTEYWTLGEAVYGKSSQDATLLDDILRGALLWAPCSMSSKWNVTQQLNTAGGRFQSSFLPSYINTQLPLDFQQQWTFIESRKSSYPVAESKFEQGAQGSWLPGRIQDVEFRKPFSQERWQTIEGNSMPEIHFISAKASEDAQVTYRLDFNVAYELQTTHPAYTMSMGCYSAELMGLLGNLTSANALMVGENPSHTKRLAQLSKQVLANPMVQKGFKELLSAGLALL